MTKVRQTLITEIAAAVHAYQRSVAAFDEAVAARLGLNHSDIRCLDCLADGPKTAGEIKDTTGLSSAATTTLLDRLEHRRFIRRARGTTDRRTVVVEMTPFGIKQTKKLYEPLLRSGADLLKALSDDQLQLLRDF